MILRTIIGIIVVVAILVFGYFLLFGEVPLIGGRLPFELGQNISRPTPDTGSEVSLEEIWGRAENIPSYEFDMVVTTPDAVSRTFHMWVKGENAKWRGTMEGQTFVYIFQKGEKDAYMYAPDQGVGMRIDWQQALEVTGSTPEERAGNIQKNNPVVVGEETLRGMDCAVIEWVNDGDKAKGWIWKKYGLPIRIEFEKAEGTVLVQTKNIEFGEIPDSEFQIPDWIQMTEVPDF